MLAEKIKDLCSNRRMTIPQLAEKIGMSKSFYTTLKNDSLKVETLIKIADVLEVPITSFFDNEAINGPALIEEVEKLNKEIKDVYSRNKELEEIIRSKRAVLQLVYYNLMDLKIVGQNETQISDSISRINSVINSYEMFEPDALPIFKSNKKLKYK